MSRFLWFTVYICCANDCH